MAGFRKFSDDHTGITRQSITRQFSLVHNLVPRINDEGDLERSGHGSVYTCLKVLMGLPI